MAPQNGKKIAIASCSISLWLFCCTSHAAEAALGVSAAEGPHNGVTATSSMSTRLQTDEARLDTDTDSGVVTNQVVTVAGQDFYSYFVAAWRDLESSEKFTLSIRERPSARWGSEIVIEYRQRRVFRTFLPPARAAIKPIGQDAAMQTYQAVVQADLERQLISDVDIGKDEY